ncbi:MAG: alpha/beta fold hydrolase, partial [Lachnospiraceae bacterium]|nr:alpha/beta fold hydrolase [Lachnospiraceae bacterium]
MNYTLTEDILRADGFSCRYIAFGKGKEPMVLIPGLSMKSLKTSARSVAASNRVFTDRYRVYVFDSREDLPPDFTVEDMAKDLALCMKALGIKGADILGISQGGMIAQYLALSHPELVRKLVLAVTLGSAHGRAQGLRRRPDRPGRVRYPLGHARADHQAHA